MHEICPSIVQASPIARLLAYTVVFGKHSPQTCTHFAKATHRDVLRFSAVVQVAPVAAYSSKIFEVFDASVSERKALQWNDQEELDDDWGLRVQSLRTLGPTLTFNF